MTQNSQDSQETKTTKSDAALQTIRDQLRDKGVDTDSLVVFNLTGSEQIIGEVHTKYMQLVGVQTFVKNPKRFIRLQSVSAQGLSIQFLVGDLDMVQEGEIQVIAPMAYRVREQSVDTQKHLYNLLLQYFDVRTKNKAADAGLVVPDSIKGRLK